MNRDRPSILTERGFDRRLAAMVLIAFVAHILLLAATVLFGQFRLRPLADIEAYTVEMIDGGELGGHMPAGLPAIDVGSASKSAPRSKAQAKAAPKPPVAEPPPPEPPKAAEPPKPEPKPEPPPPPEPPRAEPPKPEVVAQAKLDEDDGDELVVPAAATPTPSPRPSPRPTVAATPTPTAAPAAVATPRPPTPTRGAPTATPVRRPAATPTRAAPKSTPRATATLARPAATRTPTATPRPESASAKAAPAAPAATPTPLAREARIADALARVQKRVEESGSPAGETAPAAPQRDASAGAPQAGRSGGQAPSAGGVGGTDAPDPRRGIGIGPGAGGAGKVRGLEFLLYYNEMIARIRAAWAWPGDKPGLVVKVRFRILDDGTIAELRVTEPSGDGSYDASVLRAVRATSPLAPPPAVYRKDFADVELTFQPSDLQMPP